MQKFLFTAFVILCSSSLPVISAPGPHPVSLENTEVRYLRARSNDVSYKLYVSLPREYADGDRRFHVVFLLDADYSFAIARNIVEHLSDRGDLEPLILVGIAYDGPPQYRINRTRDYTPTPTPDGHYGKEIHKHSGGGPKFRQFLTEELIPFVDATYRTRKDGRALVGHSFGGLFSSWLLLTANEFFERYIIVSPSLFYDDRLLFTIEKETVQKKRPLRGKAYLAVGDREARMMSVDLTRFATSLRQRGHARLSVRDEVFRDETHNSVFPTALSRGLRWVFGGR